MTALLTAFSSSKRKVANLAILLSLITLVFPNLGAAATAKTGQENSLVFEIKSKSIHQATKIKLATENYKQNIGPHKNQVVTKYVATTPKTVKTVKKTIKIARAQASTEGIQRVFWSEAQIAEYACPKFGTDCKTFLAILKAENGTHECTRNNRGLNRNGSVDYGLAQINDRATPGYTAAQLMDCKTNLDIAFMKYAGRGNRFTAWSAYNSGAYKKHLAYINL
jgi:hypothetical protein